MKKKPPGKNIMACPITYGGHKYNVRICYAGRQLETGPKYNVRICYHRVAIRRRNHRGKYTGVPYYIGWP